MLRDLNQPLVANDHVLRQSPCLRTPAKTFRDVKTSLVSSTEPAVGMEEHPITYFPSGLCANFLYDTCRVTARNEAWRSLQGVEGRRGQNEQVPGIEGDWAKESQRNGK